MTKLPVRRRPARGCRTGLRSGPILWTGFPSLAALRPGHLILPEVEIQDGHLRAAPELPGIDPAKDVDITVRDGQLTIKAERIDEQDHDMTDEANDSEGDSASAISRWISESQSLPTELVPIQLIHDSCTPRIRGLNMRHVTSLLQSSTSLPPITLQRDTMKVIDGLHRLKAAELRGATHIDARFFEGSSDDAFALGVNLNVTHGLPLSLTDRKAAAERLLRSKPHWSDRFTARLTGLSHKTVASIRNRSTGENAHLNDRLGHDGRIRPLSPIEGRRRAAEIVTANPKASLREIARAAGISTGTARDVRNRMQHGHSPLPNQLEQKVDATVADVRPPALIGRNKYHDNLRSGCAALHRNAALLERLRKDPALRFTETGRALLRHLTIAVIEIGECIELVDSIPMHCAASVAQLAQDNAHAWQELARKVEKVGAPSRTNSR